MNFRHVPQQTWSRFVLTTAIFDALIWLSICPISFLSSQVGLTNLAPSKCAASRCWRTMSDCGAFQRGAISALPQYRNSHASFPKISIIFLRRSRRPSRNAQADMMGVSIVHSIFIAENLSYSVIQMFKRCQVEIELFHTTI
jgi:hypothetical protein